MSSSDIVSLLLFSDWGSAFIFFTLMFLRIGIIKNDDVICFIIHFFIGYSGFFDR